MKRSLMALPVITVLAVTGCSGGDGQTLADSKSPAQLLRSEAVARIPAHVVGSTGEFTDDSVACRDPEDDPDELYRAWRSRGEVQLYDAAVAEADATVDQLIQSFLDQGWSDRSLGSAGVQYDRFIWSEESSALLRVTAERAGVDPLAVTDEGAEGAVIIVEARGACVLTGGPDSDEVTSLEQRD